MSYLYDPRPQRSSQAAWRRREARRRQYMRRRILAAVILLLLAGALGYGGYSLLSWWQSRTSEPAAPAGAATEGPVTTTTADLPFTPEFYLNGADMDGDGQVERIAVGKAEGSMRHVALISRATGKEQMVGAALSLPDGSLSVQDLPRAERVLVWGGALPRRGEPVQVNIGGAKALEAAGGEPDWKAWRLDATRGLVPVDYYALLAPVTPPEPTMILVDKGLNVLWFYEEGKLVQTARVATGLHIEGPPPTAANQRINQITPTGRFTISLMIPGVPYYRESIPAGDPRNPLGTRWLGFNAFEGDKGNLWAIHGTNDPSRLGQWLSSGSIEMENEAVELLYERVKVGTPIVIQTATAQ